MENPTNARPPEATGVPPPAPGSLPFYALEVSRLKVAAELMEAEAQTWAEGFAGQNPDGSLRWDKEYEWAHVRWHKLRTSAAGLRGMVARFTKKANKADMLTSPKLD